MVEYRKWIEHGGIQEVDETWWNLGSKWIEDIRCIVLHENWY